MFKKILSAIWTWILPKTTIDEKVIEVIDEIELKNVKVKKEIKDVIDAVKVVPIKPKRKYYKSKAKAEPKK